MVVVEDSFQQVGLFFEALTAAKQKADVLD